MLVIAQVVCMLWNVIIQELWWALPHLTFCQVRLFFETCLDSNKAPHSHDRLRPIHFVFCQEKLFGSIAEERIVCGASGVKYKLVILKVCGLPRASRIIHLIVPCMVIPMLPPIPFMLKFVVHGLLQKSLMQLSMQVVQQLLIRIG